MDYSEDPIAVIGLSVRLPQDATDPEKFWQMLMRGESARSDPPQDRFNVDAFRSDISTNGKGCFVTENVQNFDPQFFSINAADASSMDPVHRWMLELVFQAFENAGLLLEDIAGTKTSVFATAPYTDFERLTTIDTNVPKNLALGTAISLLANRVSWFFDLKGQSMTIDSACSSSLVALHLACQSIKNKDSSMCVVGAGSLIMDPRSTEMLADLNCLSPDGISYTFDSRANGYCRGEGVSAVILKPYSQAIADGNTVRAVIRATNTNQNGRTAILTHTDQVAQEALIKSTYEAARLSPADTLYVESHGTGTKVGDPVEASAILRSFRSDQSTNTLYVGALKPNIGHLEGASGLASVVKATLILEKGVIPPNTWFKQRNPQIPSDEILEFPTSPTPWPRDGLRRISINAFGFGGSNAHLILEDASSCVTVQRPRTVSETLKQRSVVERPTFEEDPGNMAVLHPLKTSQERHLEMLFVWSAADAGGIKRLAANYEKHLGNLPSGLDESNYLRDLAWSLFERRNRFPWKNFKVAGSLKELQTSLADTTPQGARSQYKPVVGFVFTGQGAHWQGMAHQLLHFEVFHRSIDAADKIFRKLGSTWSLSDELGKEHCLKLSDPAFIQPATTAIQVAMIDLLRSWKVLPAAVVGHSSGEIAAAYCVGAICRYSALQIAYYRGIAATAIFGLEGKRYGMMAVALSAERSKSYMSRAEEKAGTLEISCYNSPNSTTVSGPNEDLEKLAKLVQQDSIWARKLDVPLAYHSRQMRVVADFYRLAMQRIRPGEFSDTLMISSVTGLPQSVDELQTPEYWIQNLSSPVKFHQALSNLISDSTEECDVPKVQYLLEVGAHSALAGPIRDLLQALCKSNEVIYGAMQVRGSNPRATTLQTMGQLFCLGVDVDISAVNNINGKGRLLTDLPAYPFDHSKRYWVDSKNTTSYLHRSAPRHSLLGTPVKDWNALLPRWEHRIKLREHPWIQHHKVNNVVLYPIAGLISMAIEAARQLLPAGRKLQSYIIENLYISRALRIPQSNEGVEVQISLRPSETRVDTLQESYSFQIISYESSGWFEICRGLVGTRSSPLDNKEEEILLKRRSESYAVSYEKLSDACSRRSDSETFYNFVVDQGLQFGPSFQSLEQIYWNTSGQCIAATDILRWKQFHESNYTHIIHPTALDAAFQAVLASVYQGGTKSFPALVPTRVRHLEITIRPDNELLSEIDSPNQYSKILLSAQTKLRGFRNVDATVTALGSQDKRIFLRASLECTFTEGLRASKPSLQATQKLCHHVQWKPDLNLEKQWLTSRLNTLPSVSSLDQYQNQRLVTCIILQMVSTFSGTFPEGKEHLRFYRTWAQQTLQEESEEYPASMQHQARLMQQKDSSLDVLWQETAREGIDGAIVAKVAKNILEILKGQKDVLEVLFGDEDFMTRFYNHHHNSAAGFQGALQYLDLFAHERADLCILEVGAGTGGATDSILDLLTREPTTGATCLRFSQYMYTDISPEFFYKAEAAFASRARGRIKFKVLDLEKDPLEQGFQEESFDIIVASSVIHATKSIVTSLGYLHRLLRPYGKLLLGEKTSNDGFTSSVFGLLPGWWQGTHDGRVGGPLVSRGDWDQKLRQAGFSRADICMPQVEEYARFSVILTSKASHILSNGFHLPPNGSMNSLEMTNGTHTNGTKDTDSKEARKAKIIVANSSHQLNLAQRLKVLLESFMDLSCDIVDIQETVEHNERVELSIMLPEIEQPILSEISEANHAACQSMINLSSQVLWVHAKGEATNPRTALVSGLFRVLYNEYPDCSLVTLGLEAAVHEDVAFDSIVRVMLNMLEPKPDTVELQYMESESRLHIPRVVSADDVNQSIAEKLGRSEPQPAALKVDTSRTLKMTIESPGLLETLSWVDSPISRDIPSDCIEIEVVAVGMNFRDLLIALGHGVGADLGLECSGVVTRAGPSAQFRPGDRVACMVNGAFATKVLCESYAAFKIPDDMSFETAAAMPIVYLTAYAALVTLGRIKAGTSVLIHSAAGGLGQACIQLAQMYGATIFATVGNADKKGFLVENYGLSEDHVLSNKSLSFQNEIMRLTAGHGVDIIVNSLSGEALKASWHCIAPYGRFIEVGKSDIYSSGNLPMLPFSKGASFTGLDLESMRDNKQLFSEVAAGVWPLVSSGKLTCPRPLYVEKISRAENAFRLMESGKSMGKIVFMLGGDETIMVRPSALPSSSFEANATYVIAGGMGGLGRAICHWMVERGARHLILLSRQGNSSSKVNDLFQELEAKGVVVAHPPCDVSDAQALATALDSCPDMPPIKGCIQAAMVLCDMRYCDMSAEDFRYGLRPKVAATWNLHTQLPQDLDFFVLLSSLSSIIGQEGQSNYTSGNAFQDAFARYRVLHGQKAVSLNLPNVAHIGAVAEQWAAKQEARGGASAGSANVRRLMWSYGFGTIDEAELLAILDHYCDAALPILDAAKAQVVIGLPNPKEYTAQDVPLPRWLNRHMFRTLFSAEDTAIGGSGGGPESADAESNAEENLPALLGEAESLEPAVAAIVRGIQRRLSRSLSMEVAEIDPTRAIQSYGIDSLSAVEIVNWFRNAVGAELSVFELLRNVPMQELARLAALKSKFLSAKVTGARDEDMEASN